MSTPIPEFLWLRDYEERLEYLTSRQRERSSNALRPIFMMIR